MSASKRKHRFHAVRWLPSPAKICRLKPISRPGNVRVDGAARGRVVHPTISRVGEAVRQDRGCAKAWDDAPLFRLA